MILTFLLRRRSALKVLGSVIDAAQRRKHMLFLCTEHEEAKEPFQPGDFARWPLLAASRTHGQMHGTVIGLATDPLADVGVSSWFDNTLQPYNQGARIQCYISEFHKTLHMDCWPQNRFEIYKQPVVGWTMADHRASISNELRLSFYDRYDPDGKPWLTPSGCHLLFTLKRRVPEPWRRSLQGHTWYFKQIYRAWHAAKAAGVPLVMKTRPKHGDPWWLRRFGCVIGEESMYPATSLQLLAGTKRATHFMSGAHAEARLMNVPVVNHRVPMTHVNKLPGYDCSYFHTMREAEVSREEYGQEMWGGFDDCQAGERVMDVVEAL